MSKELADRLEMIRHRLTLAKDRWGVGMVDETIAALRSEPAAYVLVGHTYKLPNNGMSSSRLNMTGHNLPDDTAIYAEPSRESRAEPVAGQLSAEEIEQLSYGPWTFVAHCGESVLTFTSAEWEPIKQQLLSSLRGTFADGIEAAAKVCDSLNFSINIDSWGAMTKHEISVLTCNECAIAIRALAQGQRSEQSSGLNGDVSSVSPSSSSSAPNGVERTGNSAQIDTVTGRRDGHPTEQDADELLREVLDWGLPDDLKQRIDAHLARKEQK